MVHSDAHNNKLADYTLLPEAHFTDRFIQCVCLIQTDIDF